MLKIITLLAVIAIAVAQDSDTVFVRTAAPGNWKVAEELAPEETVTFYVALTQRDLADLDEAFWAVANPQSESYGKFYSSEDISNLIHPPQKHHDQVTGWLNANGVESIESLGDTLKVTACVGSLSLLFPEASFHRFRHAVASGVTTVAHLGRLAPPDHLDPLIDFFSGLGQFPSIERSLPSKPRDSSLSSSSSSFSAIDRTDAVTVPATLYNLYNISSGSSSLPVGVLMQVVELVKPLAPAGYLQSDIDAFHQDIGFGAKLPVFQHTGESFSAIAADPEFAIDVEYLQAVSPGSSGAFEVHQGWLFEWAVKLQNRTAEQLPAVVSISAGWAEWDQCADSIAESDCQSLGVDATNYIRRTNAELAKLGLRGVTVVVSSGDSGAAGRTNLDCNSRPDEPVNPVFPASSPYVLSVGGTQLPSGSPLLTPAEAPAACQAKQQCVASGREQAWGGVQSHGSSGGGFSTVSPQPKFQQQAVTEFLKGSGLRPPAQFFNSSNRAYPDVSAAAFNLLFFYKNAFSTASGTSFAAPIVAGMLARLCNERLALGKPTGALGPVAPLLYQLAESDPEVFNDVTIGDNKATELSDCQIGYGATAGWDPVTGLGTINFGRLREHVLALP